MIEITELKELIDQSQKIVFFSGAGVSTNSGIPDFRSANGLFVENQGYQYSPEQIISHSFFKKYPSQFFKFYFDKLVYPDSKPNIAHYFSTWLEDQNKNVTVITQNIDGLHQMAGNKKVLELHGSVLRNYCQECGKIYGLTELKKDHEGVPRCSIDSAIIKPDVVLYEEALNRKILEHAIDAISEADLLIIAGTSLIVYPAAGLVNYFNGNKIVVINKDKVPIYQSNTIMIQQEMSKVFEQLMNH